MSPINYSRYKYTPDEMEENEFLAKFVVRNELFEDIFQDLKTSDYSTATQHYIIIGQRGQGKTTLLRKIMLEIIRDAELSKILLPVKFAEEQYQIRSLCRLWEEVADYLQSVYRDEFGDALDSMEKAFDDDDYELKCFSLLENTVKRRGKKLLLLIDNIDELIGKLSEKEQRRLREILISSNSVRIIGGSTKMLEHHHDYGKPFYQFFKIVKLQGLNKEETLTFLRALGSSEQKQKIELIIQNTPNRIETIRMFTGGTPRTLVMLFDILLDDGKNAMDDLLRILDDATPLYKHRMDDLSPQLQDIAHTIAMNWDGIATKEIAKKTRLEGKAVSAQLNQLEKYEIVESESVGKNKIYKIKERFFNIWYLMRFGRKKDRQRVEWLVRFFESWYSVEELEGRALSLIKSIRQCATGANQTFYLTEALCYAWLNAKTEYLLKESAKNHLKTIGSKLADEMSPSDMELEREARNAASNGNLLLALETYEKMKNPSIAANYKILKVNESLVGHFAELRKVAESGDYDSMLFVAAISLIFAVNKKQAAEYSLKLYEAKKLHTNSLLLSLTLLWNEEYEQSFEKFSEHLDSLEYDALLTKTYLLILLAKGQLYQAKKFFDTPKYELKDKYKPIWYALMTLMKDEFPDEIKKMGSELKESVDEILKEVELCRVRYSIDETKA